MLITICDMLLSINRLAHPGICQLLMSADKVTNADSIKSSNE